jgi:hypothetical protein
MSGVATTLARHKSRSTHSRGLSGRLTIWKTLQDMKEIPERGRNGVTSSLNEIALDQMGNRVVVVIGGEALLRPPQPFVHHTVPEFLNFKGVWGLSNMSEIWLYAI